MIFLLAFLDFFSLRLSSSERPFSGLWEIGAASLHVLTSGSSPSMVRAHVDGDEPTAFGA